MTNPPDGEDTRGDGGARPPEHAEQSGQAAPSGQPGPPEHPGDAQWGPPQGEAPATRAFPAAGGPYADHPSEGPLQAYSETPYGGGGRPGAYPQGGYAPYPPGPYQQGPYEPDPYQQGPHGQAPYGGSPYGPQPYGQEQYGQDQYGQGQYGQAGYAPQGQADAPGAGRGRGRVIAAVAGAAAVIAVVVLVLGFVWPRFFVTTVLDTHAAESSIARVLGDDLGVPEVGQVTCPSRIEVSSGSSFTCQAVIAGRVVPVTSTFTDDDGTYLVSPPAG